MAICTRGLSKFPGGGVNSNFQLYSIPSFSVTFCYISIIILKYLHVYAITPSIYYMQNKKIGFETPPLPLHVSTHNQKCIRGFCIAKDVKVSRMIILQKCARVPNTSEWREDLNVSHFESPYDFCFRSYKILGVKKKMMYRSRNLGLILIHRFELFKH